MASILIADEDAGRRSLLAISLERAGFQPTRAHTLSQALNTGEAGSHDAILFDETWRDGSLYDTIKALAMSSSFRGRIILMATEPVADDLVQATRAGVNEVLTKPIRLEHLIDRLQRHVRGEYVPPPARVSGPDIDAIKVRGLEIDIDQPAWATPIISSLLNPSRINSELAESILTELDEDIDEIAVHRVLSILDKGIGRLVIGDEGLGDEIDLQSALDSALGKLDEEVDDIFEKLQEPVPTVDLHRDYAGISQIDRDVVRFSRSVVDQVRTLLFDLYRPLSEVDPSQSDRIVESISMLEELLELLPEGGPVSEILHGIHARGPRPVELASLLTADGEE